MSNLKLSAETLHIVPPAATDRIDGTQTAGPTSGYWEWQDLYPGKDSISGLKMTRAGAQSLTVGRGFAVTEAGTKINVGTAITLSSIALTAATWYHVYLYLNGSTPAIEVVTTAPATPYMGTARSKTGDTSRRYVGSVYASGTNTLGYFAHSPGVGQITFLENTNAAPFLILSNGPATTETNVTGVVPVSAVLSILFVSNGNASYRIAIGNSEDNASLANTSGVYLVNPSSAEAIFAPLDANQQFNYLVGGAGAGAYIFQIGYFYER